MVKRRFSTQLWISFGILFGSVIIAAAVLQFLSGKLSADAAAIVSDRAAVQGQTNTLANLAQLEAEAPQATQYEAAMDELLPDQYGLVTFPQWLSQLGSKDGVTANAAFQGAVVLPAGTAPGTAQFSFNLQGSSQELATFLMDMNESPGFLVNLTSFNLTSNGSSENITGQGTLFFR